MSQVNQFLYTLDRICTGEGEPRCRVHLTSRPGVDPTAVVEVHLQPLLLHEADATGFVDRVRKRLPELVSAGTRAGWVVVE